MLQTIISMSPPPQQHNRAAQANDNPAIAATIHESPLGLPAVSAEGVDLPAELFLREQEDLRRQSWPALIAAVTDVTATLTDVHRTWSSATGTTRPLVEPRVHSSLLGHAVRFGIPQRVLTAGEASRRRLFRNWHLTL